MLNNKFRNLDNESFGVIFNAASFAWPLISLLINQHEITSKFQQNTIQFHGTFHSLFLEKVVFKAVNTNLGQLERPLKVTVVFWRAKELLVKKRSMVLD